MSFRGVTKLRFRIIATVVCITGHLYSQILNNEIINFSTENYPYIYLNSLVFDSTDIISNPGHVQLYENGEIKEIFPDYTITEQSRNLNINTILLYVNHADMTEWNRLPPPLSELVKNELNNHFFQNFENVGIPFQIAGVKFFNLSHTIMNSGLLRHSYNTLVDSLFGTPERAGDKSNQPGIKSMIETLPKINLVRGSQKLAIFFSVRGDNATEGEVDSLISMLQMNNITTFVFTRPTIDINYNRLTKSTNGKIFPIDSLDNYPSFFKEITDKLNQSNRYYYFSSIDNNQKNNSIKLIINNNGLQDTSEVNFGINRNLLKPSSNFISILDTIRNEGESISLKFNSTLGDQEQVNLFYKAPESPSYTVMPFTKSGNSYYTNVLIPPGGLHFFVKYNNKYSAFTLPSAGGMPEENPYCIQTGDSLFRIEHNPGLFYQDLNSEFSINYRIFPSQDSAFLYHRRSGDLFYNKIDLSDQAGVAHIPLDFMRNDTLEYYFIAYKDNINYKNGYFDFPHKLFYNEKPRIVHDYLKQIINKTGISICAEFYDETEFLDSIYYWIKLNDWEFDSTISSVNYSSYSACVPFDSITLTSANLDTLYYYFKAVDNFNLDSTTGVFASEIFYNDPPIIVPDTLDEITGYGKVNFGASLFDTTHYIENVKVYYRQESLKGSFDSLTLSLSRGNNNNGYYSDSILIDSNWNMDTLTYYFIAWDDDGMNTSSGRLKASIFINSFPEVIPDTLNTLTSFGYVPIGGMAVDSTRKVDKVWGYYRQKTLGGEYDSLELGLKEGTEFSGYYQDSILIESSWNLDTLSYYLRAWDDNGWVTTTGILEASIFHNDPPIITNYTDSVIIINNPINFSIEVNDTVLFIKTVIINYNIPNNTEYFQHVDSSSQQNSLFNFEIDNSFLHGDQIKYYIESIDNFGLKSQIGDSSNLKTIFISNPLGDFDMDRDVDFADYTLFMSYINSNPDNLLGDISDSTARNFSPPYPIIFNPNGNDNKITFRDKYIFSIMYNWFNYPEQEVYSNAIASIKLILPDSVLVGEPFEVELSFSNVTRLVGIQSEIILDTNNSLEFNGFPRTISLDLPQVYDKCSPEKLSIERINMRYTISSPHSRILIPLVAKQIGKKKINISSLNLWGLGNKKLNVDNNVIGEYEINVIEPVPDKFNIKSIYPNPFNNQVTIKFEIPERDIVKADIYNIRGRSIETLFNSELSRGSHMLTWSAGQFSSGIYFIRLSAGNKYQIKKVILLK